MNKLMKSEWRGRINHWVRTLKDDFYQPLGEIHWEAFRTSGQLSLEEAKRAVCFGRARLYLGQYL